LQKYKKRYYVPLKSTVPLPVLVVRYVSCLTRERPKSPTCSVKTSSRYCVA